MGETPPASMKVALWSANFARPLNGIDAWVAGIDARMAEAREQGAELFLMPEYAAAQWLSFAPDDLAASDEIAWMADRAPGALEAVAHLPGKYGMAMMPGTWPWYEPAGGRGDGASVHVNRGWLLLPDGRRIAQDKLCLTPGENDPRGWRLRTGRSVAIVRWRGLRLVTAICLDVELPALASRLAPHAPDIVLVPSMTERLSGHHRVNACARARAVELQAAVLTAGGIGDVATGRLREGNVGGAAAYIPSEPALGCTGVVDAVAPAETVDGPGPLLVAELPLAPLRRMREGGAEVWPGAWQADHIDIETEPT